jgi:transketolase
MLNKNLKKYLDGDEIELEMKATREGFGDALLEIGSDAKVFALCADLTESVQMHKFKEKYPNRFIELGVAEQNLSGVASGIAAEGGIPFMASYAAFSPGRNWEQIRTTICYNNRKVIIIGAHAGLSVGPDGGSHQALEDLALMRVLPNMNVYSPADYYEAIEVTKAAYLSDRPSYIRLAREKSPVIHENSYKLGNGINLLKVAKVDAGIKIGFITTGPIVFEALKAATELEKLSLDLGISILNISCLKPLDQNVILKFAQNHKLLVTIEEHQVSGGLGSLIAETLASIYPIRVERIGVKDRFGQSGTVHDLYAEYEINSDSIVSKVKSLDIF